MALVLHRGADLTATNLSSENLPANLDSWLFGVGKSLLLGTYLKLFQPTGPRAGQCRISGLPGESSGAEGERRLLPECDANLWFTYLF